MTAPTTQDGRISDTTASGGLSLKTETIDASANLPSANPSVDMTDSPATDAKAAVAATPIEHVAPGQTPVTEFLTKDAPASHPTPPPDEPLGASEPHVNADADMLDAPAPKVGEAGPPTITSESSALVRPREEDDDDEPVAKRSRVEDAAGDDNNEATDAAAPAAVLSNGASAEDPSKRPASESAPSAPSAPAAAPAPNGVHDEATTAKSTDAQPPTAAPTSVAPPPARSQPAHSYSKESLTPLQGKYLSEKMKNLKKTKHSIAFLAPVDHVALNIPTYPDIIKQPMDLSTMEKKLRDGQYGCVQDFSDDFDLIISNTRRFNGDAHAVTQAGMAMEAYFRKMMEAVPSADQPAPSKIQKRASPALPKPSPTGGRPPRVAASVAAPAPAASAASASGEAFALQPDGTPQIRRDSSINRPARAIKPPAPRELPYAKPRRKEAQLELKFCDHVLAQIRGPQLGHLNSVFLAPVDPVALNIPHYRTVVKHPMDLGTIAQKLKQGQYGKAAEFKKDFDLMIQNCLLFNPNGNPVRDMGIGLQREFNELWRDKDKWERPRKESAARLASASDDDSADEEDEEEEEDGADQTATIRALQQQLASMQSALADLGGALPKPKKAKSSGKSKKANGSASLPKTKLASKPKAPKKPKQVSYDEKQEISEAVGKMNPAQVDELTRIITTNCKKYADQEEMELEIDDLPNDVQIMLLSYVRTIFGGPTRRVRAPSPDDVAAMDDDDFEPAERGAKRGGKRKKHKPMGKKEQEDTISSIQRQLAQFSNLTGSGSESPSSQGRGFGGAEQGAETSGDDESDESEEE